MVFKLKGLLATMYHCFIFTIVLVTVADGNRLASLMNDNQKPSEGDTTEFRLTKLLNIELGGDVDKLHRDLQKTILCEAKEDWAGARNVPTNISTETLEEIVKLLKGLHYEIFTLKQNISDIASYTTRECLTESDILGRKSFPVGVTYHRSCDASSLNKEVTGIKKTYPRSCKEVQEKGINESGIYQIKPRYSEKPIMVLCDMETQGGGWTHIQKRYDGSVDFFLDWRQYKFGFGDLESEFWLGLENIYKMTGYEASELLIELVDRENKTAYARYRAFGIGPETEGYPLTTLNGFSGDAGDSLAYHIGSKFSTKDFDQDGGSSNCAETYKGAWWYNNCEYSNLNGKFINMNLPEAYTYQNMHWKGYRGHEYCLAKARMMIRPIG